MVEQHGEWTTELQTYDYGEGYYWSGGNHGCEIMKTEVCAYIPPYEWTKIFFNVANYDTDGFFGSTIPDCLVLPVGGFYACSVNIGWSPTTRAATDLAIEIRSAIWGPIAYSIGHPTRVGSKYMVTFGQAILSQGEEIGVYVRNGTGQALTLLSENMLCPKLTIQWIDNFYGVIP